jgi:hypothetical protein
MAGGVELGLAHSDGEISLFVRGSPPDADISVMPSELVQQVGAWQPTAGRFREHDGVSWFVPRFPLVRGISYSLLIDGVESASVSLPALAAPATTDVISIHPAAAVLPLNLLRVYVYFSAPMSEGHAARAVAVRRLDTGEALDDVFVQMEPELWNRSRERLTLLLEPGRIKRGLVPNVEAGPPLTEGISITITVDRSFRDAAGRPLRAPAERRYLVGPAVRALVNPSAWRLVVPAAQSADALVAAFDSPLDVALLTRCLTVLDGAMDPIHGEAIIDEGDCSWRFRPLSRWPRGSYTLRVDGRLEDAAGNSVRRVFDRDLRLREHEPLDADFVDVAFTIS